MRIWKNVYQSEHFENGGPMQRVYCNDERITRDITYPQALNFIAKNIRPEDRYWEIEDGRVVYEAPYEAAVVYFVKYN